MSCPVCQDVFTHQDNVCKMPVCHHTIHVSCALNAAQYDVRCPLCRTSDPSIVPKDQADDELLQEYEEYAVQTARLIRNYRQRQYRAIRRSPALTQKRTQLRDAHQKFRDAHADTARETTIIMRRTWNEHPDLKEKRRTLLHFRRAYMRVQRQFNAALDEAVPSPQNLLATTWFTQ